MNADASLFGTPTGVALGGASGQAFTVCLQETSLNAVSQTIVTMAGVVDTFTLTPKDQVSADAIYSLSQMCQQRASGEDLCLPT